MKLPYVIFIVYIVILIIFIFYSIGNDKYIKKNPYNRPIVISDTLKHRENFNSRIPKRIWTYWHTEDIPDFVRDCINTWRVHNRDHEIVVLNRNNLNEYIPEFDIGSIKHGEIHAWFADFIRLAIINKYGGIWSDASIICNKSYNEWVHKLSPEYEFIGFLVPYYVKEIRREEGEFANIILDDEVRDKITIENWFFAAERGCMFIDLWYREAMRMNEYETRKEYLMAKRGEGVDIGRVSEYLAIYASAMRVLQIDRYPLKRIKLYESLFTGYYAMTSNKLEDLLPINHKNMYNSFAVNIIKFMKNKQYQYNKNIIEFIKNDKDIKKLELIKFTAGNRKYVIDNEIKFT